MISQWLVDFIQGSALGWVGTRDERLRPSVSWVWGARADASRDLITVFVPDIEGGEVMADLRQNGVVALSLADGISHEAYQLKGRVVEVRPTMAEERAVQDIHQAKVVSHLSMYPAEFFGGYRLYPSTAVTFRVEEAFMQTPGPGAGERLDFGAEATSSSSA